MVYFDNAATTWPKPPSVLDVMRRAVEKCGANPGRGGYRMAEDANELVYGCRKTVMNFFGAPSPENVVFTSGCTASINYALKGCLRSGDHVIISDIEHNAVVRPLHELQKYGVSVSRAHVVEGDSQATLRNFERLINRRTRMIFVTCASNVFGVMPPIYELGRLCRKYGLLFGMDAAQAAGTESVSSERCGCDFICAPAHKGLYGVMGLGVLIIGGKNIPRPIMQGGTGTLSAQREQPEDLPDRLESGTLNLPGIAALQEGIRIINSTGAERIRKHELETVRYMYDQLAKMSGVSFYTARPMEYSHAPLLSFNVGDMHSEETARLLAERGICVRAGYHCAYDAHKTFGTEKRGTVRAAPSMFTTAQDADALLSAVYDLARGKI